MGHIADDLPALALAKYGLTLKRTGNEYHSPCPECGGRDRCVWFADDKANGFCRQCLKTFWLTEMQAQDPLERLERERKARENAAREQQLQARRLKTWREHAAYRAGWHDAMNFAAREWWHAQGIADASIDYFALGARQYPLENRATGEKVVLIAYTIPIHDPQTWELVNMQYRLENPPPGVGKYRQEAGLPARSFYTHPHTGGDVLIVEGAKKAIVLDQLLGGDIQVVGLPGITPGENLIDELKGYRRKYLLPDPGVGTQPVRRFQEHLTDLRTIRLPLKPDDAVTQAGMTRDDLREWLLQTRYA